MYRVAIFFSSHTLLSKLFYNYTIYYFKNNTLFVNVSRLKPFNPAPIKNEIPKFTKSSNNKIKQQYEIFYKNNFLSAI